MREHISIPIASHVSILSDFCLIVALIAVTVANVVSNATKHDSSTLNDIGACDMPPV